MGEVWRARPDGGGPPVALKLLRPGRGADERSRGLFLREAILLSTIRHPNVCRLLDSGETEDGELFVVLELLSGRTLQERLRSETPTPGEALTIAADLASGLGTLHERGIVHRDVKPANVMVARQGPAKLLDFGLAHLGPARDLARPGEVVGSPGYTAPEILRGRSGDHRSDLWSLGAILHEMLTGSPAFVGGSRAEVAEAVLADRRRGLREEAPATPEEVVALVERTLASEPEARLGSALELATDLMRLRDDLSSPVDTRPDRGRPSFWRRLFG